MNEILITPEYDCGEAESEGNVLMHPSVACDFQVFIESWFAFDVLAVERVKHNGGYSWVH